jgi:REP-associated tyrosine transposase
MQLIRTFKAALFPRPDYVDKPRSYNLAMSIPSHSAEAGTYFVTSGTFNRRRLFQVAANAELFLETLQHYRRAGHYKLHAFVVMPDHIHLLLSPQGVALERVMALIKGGFSHQLASKLPVWQRGFTDRRVRDRNEFEMRRDYIHENPVRAGMLQLPTLYPFSSAYRAEKEKAYPSG